MPEALTDTGIPHRRRNPSPIQESLTGAKIKSGQTIFWSIRTWDRDEIDGVFDPEGALEAEDCGSSPQ